MTSRGWGAGVLGSPHPALRHWTGHLLACHCLLTRDSASSGPQLGHWAMLSRGACGGTQAVGEPSMAPGASLGRSTGRNQVLKPASGGCSPVALSSQPVWAVSVWGTSSLGIPPVQWELSSPRAAQSKGSGQFHSQGWRPLQAGVPKGQLAT